MTGEGIQTPDAANLALQDDKKVALYQLTECFSRNIWALNQVTEPYQPGSSADIKSGFDAIVKGFDDFGTAEQFFGHILDEEMKAKAIDESNRAVLKDTVSLYSEALRDTQHISGLSAELAASLVEAGRIELAEMLLGKQGWRHPNVHYLHSADKPPGFIKYEHGGYPLLKLARYYTEKWQPDDAVCCWWNAMQRLSNEDLIAHRAEIHDALLKMHVSKMVTGRD